MKNSSDNKYPMSSESLSSSGSVHGQETWGGTNKPVQGNLPSGPNDSFYWRCWFRSSFCTRNLLTLPKVLPGFMTMELLCLIDVKLMGNQSCIVKIQMRDIQQCRYCKLKTDYQSILSFLDTTLIIGLMGGEEKCNVWRDVL